MKEERLQEIKDSVEFQYTLAKAKGYDNALLFTNEEEELIEEIERLKQRIDKAIEYIKKHKEIRKHYEPIGTPMGNPNYITTHISGYYELLEILDKEVK